MILVNGSPKNGGHALERTIHAMGVSHMLVSEPSHIPFGKPIHEDFEKHCVIFRNPRNVMISWARFMVAKNTAENLKLHILNSMDNMIKSMRSYQPYRIANNVFTTTYEKLMSDPSEIRRLANYLELKDIPENAFRELYGETDTFTGLGNQSSWLKFKAIGEDKLLWDDEINTAWINAGGPELEDLLRFDPFKIYTRNPNAPIPA